MTKSIRVLWFLFLLSHQLFADLGVIPFKLVNNLIIIEIDIETKKGNFILDTGSDAVFLNSQNEQDLQNNVIFKTVNGTTNTELTKIRHLKIGEITKLNVNAYSTNLTNIENFLNIKIAGIIGAEIFNPHSIYVDFDQKEIKFYKDAPNLLDFRFDHHLDFSMKLGVPCTEITIGNNKYTFIMDSGASIHLVDSIVVASHMDNFEQLSSNVKVESLGNTSSVQKYNIKSFSLNKNEIFNQSCLIQNFSELNATSEIIISGIISISKLTEKGIMIDFHRMKMYY